MTCKEIKLAAVKEHNKPEDLWIIIEDKVYNVTNFLNEHPGGEQTLIDVAGRDGTKEFNDVGHSPEARKIMKKYYIGELAASDRKKGLSCRKISIAFGSIVIMSVFVLFLVKRGSTLKH